LHEGEEAALQVGGAAQLTLIQATVRLVVLGHARLGEKEAVTEYGKNRYLLTIMCEYTSFVELYALEDKTAERIADCLVDFCLRWEILTRAFGQAMIRRSKMRW
jgi:hypothetical protein